MRRMQTVAFAFIPLLAVALSPLVNIRASASDDADARWVADSYSRVISEVFATPTESQVVSDPNATWLLTVRIQGAYTLDRECQFTIAPTYDHHVRTTIREPAGASIRQQLAQIHHNDNAVSIEEAATRVKMEDKILTDYEYAPLKAFSDHFGKLCLGYIPQNEMTVDATRYQVWGDAGSQRVYFSILGPHSSHKGQAPLIDWITRVRSVLERHAK